eukprot:9496246-Pyramimonas_sp.AAC.1
MARQSSRHPFTLTLLGFYRASEIPCPHAPCPGSESNKAWGEFEGHPCCLQPLTRYPVRRLFAPLDVVRGHHLT